MPPIRALFLLLLLTIIPAIELALRAARNKLPLVVAHTDGSEFVVRRADNSEAYPVDLLGFNLVSATIHRHERDSHSTENFA
jgi:hypothetical protein